MCLVLPPVGKVRGDIDHKAYMPAAWRVDDYLQVRHAGINTARMLWWHACNEQALSMAYMFILNSLCGHLHACSILSGKAMLWY